MSEPRNPDCLASKHQACSGTAWDNETDTEVLCGCSCHAAVTELLDPDLTGNPEPSTHDGIDEWPFGDAARWTDEQGVVHACPPLGSGVMPCCGLTPFDVPPGVRITLEPSLVTCGSGS